MATVSQIMTDLKKKGSAQTRKIYSRHGAPENLFGVSAADMKVIAKKIKGDQNLALALYETGNSDAMYVAGMVADGAQMTKKQLDDWAKQASWYFLSEYAVPSVACQSKFACSLAKKWMKSKQENIASAGWSTYAGTVGVLPDEELDLDEVESLLGKVVKEIDNSSNRVRYTMNGFVISVGTYVKPLLKKAKAAAKKIGKIEVEMGETSCKVPLATDYIAKNEKMGRIGKKRKTTKC